jgi:hypothetical protein
MGGYTSMSQPVYYGQHSQGMGTRDTVTLVAAADASLLRQRVVSAVSQEDARYSNQQALAYRAEQARKRKHPFTSSV